MPQDHLIEKLPGRIEKHTPKVLMEGEIVEIALRGAWGEALVCTDRRLIILKGGLLFVGQTFGVGVYQQPYGNIAGVTCRTGLLSLGSFEVTTAGMGYAAGTFLGQRGTEEASKLPNAVSYQDKASAARFQEAANWVMGRIHQQHAGTTPPAPAGTPVPPPAAPTAAPHAGVFADLDRLAQAHRDGILTEAEFEAKKQVLLAKLA